MAGDFHQYWNGVMIDCGNQLRRSPNGVVFRSKHRRVRLAFALTQDKNTKTSWSVGDNVQLIPENILIQLRCASHSWRTWQTSNTSGTSNQDQSQRRTYTAEMDKMGYSMVLQNNHYHPFIQIVFPRIYIYIYNELYETKHIFNIPCI